MSCQSYSNILVKLRQPAILEPDNTGKSYIPQKKALDIVTTVDVEFIIVFTKGLKQVPMKLHSCCYCEISNELPIYPTARDFSYTLNALVT